MEARQPATTPAGTNDVGGESKTNPAGFTSSRRALLQAATGLAAVTMASGILAPGGTARVAQAAPSDAPSTAPRAATIGSTFYVTFDDGSRIGGESGQPGRETALEGMGFSYAVTQSYDPGMASGAAAGKAQHGQVVFTKQWGGASPLLFQAAVAGTIFQQVVFEFTHTTPNGEEEVAQRITLSDAVVASFVQYIDLKADSPRPLEDISLAFRGIGFENTSAGTQGSATR